MGCGCGKHKEEKKEEGNIIYKNTGIRWEDTIFYKMRRAKANG